MENEWNGGDWFFFCVLSKEKEEKEAKAPTMNSKIHDEAAYDVASPFIIRISCFSYTPVRSLWKLEQTFLPSRNFNIQHLVSTTFGKSQHHHLVDDCNCNIQL